MASASSRAGSRCGRSRARRSASATRPGYRAAGGMPLVLMQSSGLGNSLNALGSLVIPYGLGFPVVIVDAGHARRAQPGPDAARPNDRGDARAARRAGVRARPGRTRPRLSLAAPSPSPRARACSRRSCSRRAWTSHEPRPRSSARDPGRARPARLCVSSLGTPTSALRAASDDGPHLYMGGSMGTALAAAIGVAEKRPGARRGRAPRRRRGADGRGSFWSLAGIAPANLLAVVLVDGHYTITGGQPLGVPDAFGAVAAALGLATATARTAGEIAAPRRLAPAPGACSRSATTTASGPARRRSSTRRSCAGASRKPPIERRVSQV